MRLSQKTLMAAFQTLAPNDQKIVAEFMGLKTVEPKTHHYYTKAEMENGGGYACDVSGSCLKKTRSYERSLRHATTNAELKEFGHIEV